MNTIVKLESILTDHTLTMVLIMLNAVPGDAATKALSGTETQADYNRYRKILTEVDLYTIVNRMQENVDSIARILNTSILDAAEQSIPNKIVTIRPTDSPWMHNKIRKLIRQRKRVHKQAKRTNNDQNWAKY